MNVATSVIEDEVSLGNLRWSDNELRRSNEYVLTWVQQILCGTGNKSAACPALERDKGEIFQSSSWRRMGKEGDLAGRNSKPIYYVESG